MKRVKTVATASIIGIAMAGSVAAPAFAWHPKGTIIKYVQNQTTGSALSDANDAAHAVSARPGDILKYVVEVSNTGAADSKGLNDMANTMLVDTLPAGVSLVSNPSQTVMTESLGTVAPGKKVTREYLVKVTSQTNGTVLENKACLTGNSKANDNPQKGCDVADVTVTVPPTPTPTPTPTPPAVQAAATVQPQALPNTGMPSFMAPVAAVIAAGLGYAGYTLRTQRRLATQKNR